MKIWKFELHPQSRLNILGVFASCKNVGNFVLCHSEKPVHNKPHAHALCALFFAVYSKSADSTRDMYVFICFSLYKLFNEYYRVYCILPLGYRVRYFVCSLICYSLCYFFSLIFACLPFQWQGKSDLTSIKYQNGVYIMSLLCLLLEVPSIQ